VIEAALRTILAHPKNPESFAHAKRVLDYHDANPQTKGATSMSLEQVIQENTAAINALIATMVGKGASPSAIGTAVHEAVEKALTPAEDKAAAAAHLKDKAEKAEAAKEEKAPATPGTEALDYEKHVKPAALALAAKKGRDALVAALQPFGCATAKDAKPEQFAALVDALNAAAAA
jgi:hypothetical protein